jgi:hypothetical protein
MSDALIQGIEYLQKIQDLALNSEMIDSLNFGDNGKLVFTWIGTHIQRINTILQTHVEKCAECWSERDRPMVQIFAAPIATGFSIDGCCNFSTTPITVLIDVGRVIPPHWLHVVVHEYAHACVGSSGHNQEFTYALAHLCLGMGLATPSALTLEQLQSFPPCTPTAHALAFWQGQGSGI